MNDALDQRWKKAMPPFDGQTVAFASEELTPLPALRQALLTVIPALQRTWPEGGLFMLDDWHEHDGYVNVAQPTTWHEILQRIGTNEETIAFTRGDWDVRLAFFLTTTASICASISQQRMTTITLRDVAALM